ncbi:MAG TPA: hypothetical protein VIN10_03975, partial [Bacteroidales bacterium]
MKKKNNTIHLLPIILLVIGVSATFFASQIAENYLELFGLLLVVMLASLLLGALLGFLFGIPKTSNHFFQNNKNEQKSLFRPATNLEDISNWLSIIIVGLILTQATKFPFYLESISNSILANNDCIYNCQFAHAIIIGDILFSTISGFIIGYAYTRTFFFRQYSMYEEHKEIRAEYNTRKEEYGKNIEDFFVPTPLQAEKKTSKSNSKLSTYLTEDEVNVLKMIFEENNNFVVRKPLTFKENAIVNELVEKGIVKEIEG